MSPRFKVEGTGTTTTYRARWSGPVEAGADTEWNDEAGDHEAIGAIVDGTDTYETSGVPLDFATDDPANAWTLNLAVDFGAGWVEQIPTLLNAAIVDLRAKGDGAHYLMSVPEPGMILKAEGPEHDGVMNDENTLVAGNVRGGVDSWVCWPPINLSGVADHGCEYRIRNDETSDGWSDLATCRPEMSF